jgi:Large polyvalent protein associated domain 29
MATLHISCADTAKEVRKVLKAEFPGVKFSVRSHTYAGGASIRVRWTDGPTGKAVDGVVQNFKGATFDPMIDLKSYVTTVIVLDGVPTEAHYGADYIFTERDLSPEFTAILQAEFAKVWGETYDRSQRTTYDQDRRWWHLVSETTGPR